MWGGRRPTVRSRLARAVLTLWGWRLLNVPEPGPRVLAVVYPHTSNRDFPVGILWAWGVRCPVRFIAKHSLFRLPLGWILKAWGGLPVNRSRAGGNFVKAVAQKLREHDELFVVITPEGTRQRTEGWRSGFYHIAREAGVPLMLATIDWERKEVGVFDTFAVSDDMAADYERLAAAFAGRQGLHPEKQTPVRPLK